MPLEPIFQDIQLSQKRNNLKEHVKVECKTDLPKDGVSKILNVTARSVVTSSEVLDDRINYEGRATFFICYQTDDAEISKIECGSEFKGTIKTQDQGDCKAIVFSCVEKTETDFSGGRLCVSGYVALDVHLTECKRVSALTGGNDLITDCSEMEILKGYGVRETVFPVSQDFEVNYRIEDVLSQRADTVITSVQCGVGSIIVDGEILVSAILLQSREKKDIIRENKIMPFRAEIECEDAMPSMCATAFAKEKFFKTDISVDQERGKSLISASATLILSGEVYGAENLSIVADVFSINDNLIVEKDECAFVKPCDVRSESKEICITAVTDSLPVGTSLIDCIGEKAEVLNVECVADGLLITGSLGVTIFFKDADGKVFARKSESPFETTISCACDRDCEYTVKAFAVKSGIRLVSDTQTEIRAMAYFTVYPFEKCNVQMVKAIKSVGEKPKPTHALSVYIPCEGEELWSLAKRLNVRPDDLINANKELQFPLSGKERIVVFRQQ